MPPKTLSQITGSATSLEPDDLFYILRNPGGIEEDYVISGSVLINTIGKYNIEFPLFNGNQLLATGSSLAGYPYVRVPANTQIDGWEIVADQTGTVTVNILKSTGAGFPPSSPLAGLGQPKLTSQRKNSGVPTGTVNLSEGDYLQLQIPSAVTNVKLVTVSLTGRKGI